MKNLPNNLQNLELIFFSNNLGDNTGNLKYLGEGLKNYQIFYRTWYWN